MKKSTILTSKRTFDRKLQAKVEEIRKSSENFAMSNCRVSAVRENYSEVGEVLNHW